MFSRCIIICLLQINCFISLKIVSLCNKPPPAFAFSVVLMGSCLPGLIPAATGLLVLSMAWELCSCPQRHGGARRACCHTEGPTHVTLIVLGHRACLLLFDWATPRRGSRLPRCLSSVSAMVAHQRRRQTTPLGSFSPHSQLHTGALSLCPPPSLPSYLPLS